MTSRAHTIKVLEVVDVISIHHERSCQTGIPLSKDLQNEVI